MGIGALRRIQIGVESPRGTLVPATKILLGNLRMTPRLESYEPEDEDRNSLGLLHRSTIIGQSCDLRYEGSATYEQLINFLAMTMIGGVTPTTPGGGTLTRDWAFAPSLTAANTQDSFTFEYGDNQQEYEAAFVVGKQLELSYDMGGPIRLTADLVGRYPAKSTFTGSLAAPTVVDIVSKVTTIAVDTTWAGLGGTAKSTLLLGGTVRIPSGIELVKYADGSLNWSTTQEGKRALEVELLLAHGDDGETQYDNYAARTTTFVRLETLGPLIEGALYKRLQIDMALRWTEPPEMFELESGLTAIRFKGKSVVDPTSANDYEVNVRNAVTAMNGAT